MNDETILPIILTIALSLGIALFAYFLLIHFTVDADPQNARENNLLNFYEQHHDEDIYILGSSLVQEGIDAYVVEDLMQKNLANRSVWVLGMSSDTPLDRSCEIDNIITSKPKMIVIGLTYWSFGINNINEDRMALCLQRKNINYEQFTEESQYFFNGDKLKRISSSPFERFFENRKFIYPSAGNFVQNLLFHGNISTQSNKLRSYPTPYVTNFKDSWVLTTNWTDVEKIQNMEYDTRDYVSKDLNSQKKALQYTITKLQQNNISVIIINMPIDPHYSSTINESSRYNFSNFLNSTGVQWYNYEREYPTEFFADRHHMNVAGRINFSSTVATLIVENLKKGA